MAAHHFDVMGLFDLHASCPVVSRVVTSCAVVAVTVTKGWTKLITLEIIVSVHTISFLILTATLDYTCVVCLQRPGSAAATDTDRTTIQFGASFTDSFMYLNRCLALRRASV